MVLVGYSVFGNLVWRIFAPRMLRLCICPVEGCYAGFVSLLRSGRPPAIAVIKPKQQTDEEERHYEHEKDQCGFQKIIHGETSLVSTEGYVPTAHRDNRNQ